MLFPSALNTEGKSKKYLYPSFQVIYRTFLKTEAQIMGYKNTRSAKNTGKFDPVRYYFAEVGQYPLLSPEDEKKFALKVQNHGDDDAAYRLITANLRLVVKIAMTYQNVRKNWIHQNLSDLIQEGNIGLVRAAYKFDPGKNVKFSYYASFWIKAYVLKFIMDNWSLVKIGTTQAQRKLFFNLNKEKQKLIANGFNPEPRLISEQMGLPEKEVINMNQRIDGRDVSLDAPLKEDSDGERINFFVSPDESGDSVEDRVAKKEVNYLIRSIIAKFGKKLSQRELEIFKLRTFSDSPLTLRELSERYGISRERVRQIENGIIGKIKDFFIREVPDVDYFNQFVPESS